MSVLSFSNRVEKYSIEKLCVDEDDIQERIN
ncbi:hypothetical protein PPL_06733 [Heterostelium album PN500]|uniref:Uncharacterized protein n=1 Tax=Heterostelium pallidum (strain ATCC 26659 / Pp 5 / PN500) TaxID=670386 RepID=D3BFJ9_HETP5|nr:hypothetical protein PPL_06733 [Heterostelium album PN500]EFA79913.1 hypothetical protein PPL_06733 [Heterostelium album PN500]|eukprot:XP_020432034.1 hypothetical protein PPL_06733 [Heterostelium album PN500]